MTKPSITTGSTPSSTPSASWKLGILLAFIVPALFFGALELGCRALNLESRFVKRNSTPQALDMPTWMLREDNARARMDFQKVDEDALEWMSMFEEGDGFRVRLTPNTQRSIVNTFSRIPADKSRRYLIASNNLGFRSPEISFTKPANTFRILVFGDSSSFGWGVDENMMFSEQLKEKLQSAVGSRKNIEIGNFAIPGDSSEYGKLLFDHYAPLLSPDLVILGFGANDAKAVITPHREQVEVFKASSNAFALRTFLNHSAMVRTIAAALSRANPTTTIESLPQLHRAVPRKRYSSNLAAMGKAARELSGAQTLLLTLCAPANYRKAAQKTAQRNGMLFFDGQTKLLESIPALKDGSLLPNEVSTMRREYGTTLATNDLFYVSSDACHPNAVGHSIIAAQLANTILEANLL